MIKQLPYISKEYIAQFLPNNPVIIEAGGNKGRDTIEFKKIWPHAIIHVFEPVPHLFEQLQEQTKSLPNVFCYPFALSDKTEHANFYESKEIGSISSLLEPHLIKQEKPDINFTKRTIQTISLNDWFQKYSINQVDLLWLDVQGAELQVLQGATDQLQNVKAIHCEVALNHRYARQALYSDVVNFLGIHHFTVAAEAIYKTNWGNALFVKA